MLQIESGLFRRQGETLTNFQRTLPAPQSDLAQQLLKDPYNFDFLTLAEDAREKEVEAGLVEHILKFLMALGVGFAFVGRQYPLDIGGKDFRLDLLFYHLKLRCFVVIDLKGGEFKPEYAGKMNFYLAAVDDTLKHPSDHPNIGLILCCRGGCGIRDSRHENSHGDLRVHSLDGSTRRIQGQLADHRRDRSRTWDRGRARGLSTLTKQFFWVSLS